MFMVLSCSSVVTLRDEGAILSRPYGSSLVSTVSTASLPWTSRTAWPVTTTPERGQWSVKICSSSYSYLGLCVKRLGTIKHNNTWDQIPEVWMLDKDTVYSTLSSGVASSRSCRTMVLFSSPCKRYIPNPNYCWRQQIIADSLKSSVRYNIMFLGDKLCNILLYNLLHHNHKVNCFTNLTLWCMNYESLGQDFFLKCFYSSEDIKKNVSFFSKIWFCVVW